MEHEITPPGPAKAALVAVVDDDPDIIELVSVHLKKTGMKVREFLDADSFYRFLGQDTPDLVLLDLMLPDADGVEVCKFMQEGRPALRRAGYHADREGGRSRQGPRAGDRGG